MRPGEDQHDTDHGERAESDRQRSWQSRTDRLEKHNDPSIARHSRFDAPSHGTHPDMTPTYPRELEHRSAFTRTVPPTGSSSAPHSDLPLADAPQAEGLACG